MAQGPQALPLLPLQPSSSVIGFLPQALDTAAHPAVWEPQHSLNTAPGECVLEKQGTTGTL